MLTFDRSRRRVVLLAAVACALSHAALSEAAFTEVTTSITGVSNGMGAWGDYDGDGDLDVVVVGNGVAKVFRNNGSSFTDIAAALTPVDFAAAAWGDMDGDGDLDLAIIGLDGTTPTARIYRNTAGVFRDIVAGLVGVYRGAVAWGDADQDGDLDLAIAGHDGHNPSTILYRNSGGASPTFTDMGLSLPGVYYSSLAWGDCNGDGDPDLLLSGLDSTPAPVTKLIRGPAFVELSTTMVGLSMGSVAWGDCDADGDLDVVLSGTTNGAPSGATTKVYRNNNAVDPVFTELSAGLPGVYSSGAEWGDFDADGDLDILLGGTTTGATLTTRLYLSSGGSTPTYTPASLTSIPLTNGNVAWGDDLADGALDFLVTGTTGTSDRTRLFRGSGVANTPPSPPSGLAVALGTRVTFSWNPSVDNESPAGALSYQMRIGTTPGGHQVHPAPSDSSGTPRLPARGDADHRSSLVMNLPHGIYYWSVQSVDGGFRRSAFATEQSLQFHGFDDIGAGLPPVTRAAAVWGDYDSDGRLDLALAGVSAGGNVTRIYRNTASGFVDLGAVLPGLADPALAWGDYDRDGDLDLAIAGDNDGVLITRIYANESGTFVDTGADLPGVGDGALAWGDYDRDGDLDLAIAGATGPTTSTTRIMQNFGFGFFDLSAGLPGVSHATLAWSDYDKDGDLDLTLAGLDASSTAITRVYRNSQGSFTDAVLGLPGAQLGGCDWGDYDNDGDLDLALIGSPQANGGNGLFRIFRNDGAVTPSLTLVQQLAGLVRASVAWGDYDDDGDLDLVLCGYSGSLVMSIVLANGPEGFAIVLGPGQFTGNERGAMVWGDMDGDGDLDLAAVGDDGFTSSSRIYRNAGSPANTKPTAPSGLAVTFGDTTATLSWQPATDAQTPASGLTYNLRVGSTPGGIDIVAPMANASTGARRVPQLGNVQQRLSWTIQRFALPQTFYWSVQAIDASFVGSAWASSAVTGVGGRAMPARATLTLAGPNPFRSAASMTYTLVCASRATLAIHDVSGRRVRTLADGDQAAGLHVARWDGGDACGTAQPPGLYFARLTVAGETRTLKLLRLE